MFITFEGIEGAGKGTMLAKTAHWFEEHEQSVLLTREPGGCRLGEGLRSLLLDARNFGIKAEAELFMYLADRAQHVGELVRPALLAGRMVISDRYADSTIVYQGYGRGLDLEMLFKLNDLAVGGLWPDLTLVLDLDAATGLARARERNSKHGLEESEGRFEAEALPFHEKIRQGYVSWAGKNPKRIKLIPAYGSPEEVFARIVPFLKTIV
jgi:dTMP kinase